MTSGPRPAGSLERVSGTLLAPGRHVAAAPPWALAVEGLEDAMPMVEPLVKPASRSKVGLFRSTVASMIALPWRALSRMPASP